jgi:hypothetical protein
MMMVANIRPRTIFPRGILSTPLRCGEEYSIATCKKPFSFETHLPNGSTKAVDRMMLRI